MILLDLFLGFLKVGCFAFGGGFGAIPLIRDVVLGYGWISEESLSYMIAVSESTPGPIMVNIATYVGSSQAGFLGSVIATTAVVLPSFLIILLVVAALFGGLYWATRPQPVEGLKSVEVVVIHADQSEKSFHNFSLYTLHFSLWFTNYRFRPRELLP